MSRFGVKRAGPDDNGVYCLEIFPLPDEPDRYGYFSEDFDYVPNVEYSIEHICRQIVKYAKRFPNLRTIYIKHFDRDERMPRYEPGDIVNWNYFEWTDSIDDIDIEIYENSCQLDWSDPSDLDDEVGLAADPDEEDEAGDEDDEDDEDDEAGDDEAGDEAGDEDDGAGEDDEDEDEDDEDDDTFPFAGLRFGDFVVTKKGIISRMIEVVEVEKHVPYIWRRRQDMVQLGPWDQTYKEYPIINRNRDYSEFVIQELVRRMIPRPQ